MAGAQLQAQNQDIATLMGDMGAKARAASRVLAAADAATRNRALLAMAAEIRAASADILAANQQDLTRGQDEGLAASMMDRLALDSARLEAIAASVEAISTQEEVLGAEITRWQRPNGLDIARVAIPIGVIGIIYESRPNVTADAGALCLKSGNAVILRGGSDAFQSSSALVAAIGRGLEKAGLPKEIIQLVPTTDRAAVGAMLSGLNGAIDLIVPRGGKSLVGRVQAEARVPVLAHLEGLCHSYVHQEADLQKAFDIVLNAKMRRTGICGATETLLVDRVVAAEFLPKIGAALAAKSCELRADGAALEIFTAAAIPATLANEEDWRTEYLAPILSVAVVDNIAAAIGHIDRYGSGHTDAIITENQHVAEEFLAKVDSAIVLVNASTQFADGGEFGFGAEIGIGTGRLHARGPVGAEGLTTYKYLVRGTGQTRP